MQSWQLILSSTQISTEQKRTGRYKASAGIAVRPEPEIKIITDRAWFKAEPREIKGYYVDKNSISKGVHSPEYYGYGYFRYTLVKLETRGG